MDRRRRMNTVNRYTGCLLAGAAGDALGYTVEFDRESDIFSRYGHPGITEYELRGGAARISDDTQMTLYTAAGLLAGQAKGTESGPEKMMRSHFVAGIADAYRAWYRTQMQSFPASETGIAAIDRLSRNPELFHRRAPGMTCLSAIAEGCNGTPEHPINQSKGCGGVMRVAPVGLFFAGRKDVSPEDVIRIGAEAAALTHGHPLGWLSAAVLVGIIHELAGEEERSIPDAIRSAMKNTRKVYPGYRHVGVLEERMEKAFDLAGSGVDDLEGVHALGEGWVAEEALAIAVFCALRYPENPEQGIIAAVNHNGDSDSTGAIAGNIIGANTGKQAIPEKYLNGLELREIIEEMAKAMY